MKNDMNVLNWLNNWFASECDRIWEHGSVIKIYTIGNPGWGIEIQLKGTKLEDLEIPWKLIEHSDMDWYGIAVKDKEFSAYGDPSKLVFLLEQFRELLEKQYTQ